jgi:glycosyltransferase involved in cell wall biosynthesis
MPKISIIVPVYNAARTLPDCLKSILSQEGVDFEVILVNDGSTDDSGFVCDSMAAEDSRVTAIHQLNGGVSSARNAGLEAAQGEFVTFVDADDALLEGALQNMYSEDADFVVAGYRKGNQICAPLEDRFFRGREQVISFLDSSVSGGNLPLLNTVWCKLFRLEVIRSAGLLFDTSLRYGEDKLFVLKYLTYINSVRTLPLPVYDYILRDGSLSCDESSDKHLIQVIGLIEKYGAVLNELKHMYPCASVKGLYHHDLVGRYCARVLTEMAKRRSDLLTLETLKKIYGYMDEDNDMGLFSLRAGQIPNILLYKIGCPSFSLRFYRFTSSIMSLQNV